MKINTAKRLGDVKEYYFSTKLREIARMRNDGIDVLNLGIGSPDLPASRHVVEELHAATNYEKAHAYQSYSGIPELRKAFAAWYAKYFQVSLNPDTEILPLMGSKEGIMHISMTYLEEGDQVLVPNPGYPTYSSAAKLTGATIVHYNLSEDNGWLPNLEELERQDLSKVKIMWVNYPHMPTGAHATRAFFKELIAFGKKHHILICNDNPYSFILNDDPMSILSVEGAEDIALELNSLSKSHNMAGWRMGMVAGQAEYISNILRFKSNMDSGMFLPLQKAAIQALHLPQSWYNEQNAIYKERQQKVFKLLDLLDCKFDRNQGGMFVWAKIPSQFKDGFELSDLVLKQAHVFITPGGIFGSQGEKYVRVSLCSDVRLFENAIERIEEVLVVQ